MSKLEEAVTQLDHAVARLESTGNITERETEHQRLRELAAQIVARVDDAVAKIDLALKGER
jgi:predicted  nucleic acid-binding Zn-ribbon protein